MESRNQHWAILGGLLAGALVGLLVNVFRDTIDATVSWILNQEVQAVEWVVVYVAEPIGRIFLNLLLMTVVPLVFASLSAGIAQLGDWRRLGSIGLRTFLFFALSMTIACITGLVLVNWFEPGRALPPSVREELFATAKRTGPEASQTMSGQQSQPKSAGVAQDGRTSEAPKFGLDFLIGLVPRNPFQAAVEMNMLQIIVFALLMGVALTLLAESRRHSLLSLLEATSDLMVVLIGLVMRIAPLAVFALLFARTASFGLTYLRPLGQYVLIALLGMAVHLLVTMSLLVWWLGKRRPWDFYRRIWPVIVTAFSTSSSNATLPTSLRTAQQELGIPPQVAGFVLPLGATMNMNGTALYEGVTVLFLAQVYFGTSPDWTAQLIVIGLAVVTAIGAAGVPGGSLPLLATVLTAVGVPGEYIGMILGVDRLLDMARTVLNVVGDLVTAVFIARSEQSHSAGP
jgi:DAACS family dicarboxylate/amino acid:cation (Na+ or H+) symporter